MKPLLLLPLLSLLAHAETPTLTLGVLEELRERDANTRTFVGTKNYKTHLRVMFRKKVLRWESFPRLRDLSDAPGVFPKRGIWSACYQGKRVVSFESINAPGYRVRSLVGSQVIPPQVKIPTTDLEGNKFAGWREEKAELRPLVSTSGGRCDDVDYWRKDDPGKQKKEPLIARLREELAKTTWIELPENEMGTANGLGAKNYKFKDEQVTFGDCASARRSQARIVTLKVKDLEGHDHDEVFFINAQGEISYLGSSLYFLDAGDYDNSANSTIVMRMQAQLRDGYVLVDHMGKRLADFYWSYE